MSTTSVKMDEHTKSRLEELQAEIKLETGRKVTQQELLDALVERAYASREEVIDSFRDEGPDLTDEEIERWLSGTSDWGVETSEDEIDDILYGEDTITGDEV